MGGFLGSILGGANPTLAGDINQSGQIAGFGTSVGEGAINTGTGFLEDILSGNQAETAKVLAPQISDIAKQANEKTQTNAEFGNRSGGTNASNQNTTDTARAGVNDLISKLTSTAATTLPSIGQGLLSTGLQANSQQADESQQQMKNFQDSVLGSGISDFAATGLNAAEGALHF